MISMPYCSAKSISPFLSEKYRGNLQLSPKLLKEVNFQELVEGQGSGFRQVDHSHIPQRLRRVNAGALIRPDPGL